MLRKWLLITTPITILFLCSLSFAVEKRSLQSILVQLGGKVVKRTVSKPSKWEKEEFKSQGKQSFLVKLRAKDGLLYKFLVEEEYFANEEDAKKRLPRIKEFPPELKEKFGTAVDKMHAEYLLREGFIFYNKVYIVSAFAYSLELEGDIKRLREKLEKEIKN